MVLHSTGYNVRVAAARGEATRLLEANQISVEHRFFSASRPKPANWTKLDIWQAASDHHRIVEALEPVFPTRWISTGTSKGGMATSLPPSVLPVRRRRDDRLRHTEQRRRARDDRGSDEFLARVGTDPSCRERLNALQQEALGAGRAELLNRFTAWAAANGGAFHGTLGSAERALEYTILDTPFTFWQVRSQAACPDVPAAPASTDTMLRFHRCDGQAGGIHRPGS